MKKWCNYDFGHYKNSQLLSSKLLFSGAVGQVLELDLFITDEKFLLWLSKLPKNSQRHCQLHQLFVESQAKCQQG